MLRYIQPMSRLLKILVFSCILLVGSLIIPSFVLDTPLDFAKAVQEGNNLQWYLGGAQGMMATTTDTLVTAIGGARDENGNLLQAGALQTTTGMMASLYQHRPASSLQYLAFLLNHSGITKTAFAQGKGYDFLTQTNLYGAPGVAGQDVPIILNIWIISRNIENNRNVL